nr:glycoside hydrolase family 68 protein [Bacillus subtilis]
MNIKKFAKQATVLTFTTALLAGGATQAFAKETNQKPYKETYGISHITRHDMLQIPEQQKNEKYQVPEFDSSTIKNISSAKVPGRLGQLVPLQNADGTVANYHGYHIVFALAGDPKNADDTSIYMFYQKVGETSIDSWKNAGTASLKTATNSMQMILS